MCSTRAGLPRKVSACKPNCVSGRGRMVINLRASTPLGHNVFPGNNVHVIRGDLRTCNCRLSPVAGRVFAGCEGARGRNIFSTCASRVVTTHHSTVVAKLPSTCKHKHVVNSCHHMPLCKARVLVRRGGHFRGHLSVRRLARRVVRDHRRVARRVGTLGTFREVYTNCNFSIAHPTGSTHRTIRFLCLTCLTTMGSRSKTTVSLKHASAFLSVCVRGSVYRNGLARRRTRRLVSRFVVGLHVIHFLHAPRCGSLFSNSPI